MSNSAATFASYHNPLGICNLSFVFVFHSCSQVLVPAGQVMVTLCKGQGGTPADQPQRSWHDSWQALAMAANAGFILAAILPFDAARFPEYHSVGFRLVKLL